MNIFTEETLREDVHLDLLNLDSEIQKQPGLYQYWADQLADAKRETGRAEIALKVRLGEVERDFRKNGLPSGNKVTEASIKAELESEPEIRDLRNALTDAYHAQGLRESTVRALDHKKAQLDNAVRLWSNGYYQDPKRDGRSNNASDDMRGHLNRKRNNDQKEEFIHGS